MTAGSVYGRPLLGVYPVEEIPLTPQTPLAVALCATMHPVRSPFISFLRASSLHIGAAAVTATLREELVDDTRLTPGEFDTAFAVARLTPGTNLLALYAQLGKHLGGWPLAVGAVAAGTLVPAAITVAMAAASQYSHSPLVASMMAGARAGGMAVLIGAAYRLLKPYLSARPWTASAVAAGAGLLAWSVPVSPFLILLLAAIAGTFLFRPT